MRWLYKLPLRFRSLFHKRRVEQELTDELRFHLERLIEERVAKGMTSQEARYAALRELGGVELIKEECRDMRRVNYIESFLQDVRYGVRQLRRNPAFTAVAVLTLALGIGANTAIFSIIDAVLLRMLPVKDPARLVLLQCPDAHGGFNSFSYPTFEYLRDHNSLLSGIFASSMPERLAVSIDGQAELVKPQLVSGGYYTTLGVSAALGRTITPEHDNTSEESAVIVISYAYWKRRFNLAPSVVGKKVTINGFPFTIIGATQPEFFGLALGYWPDITAPISKQALLMGGRSLLDDSRTWYLDVIGGRLKPGVSKEQARANLDLVFQQALGRKQQKEMLKIQLTPGSRGFSLIRDRLSTPLTILMAMVGLVLLIACANVANLVMARGTARRKEIAMRLALGASRSRLIRQLLTECVLLGMLGGTAGLLFAVWIGHVLLALVSSAAMPISINLRLDARVLGFTGAVSLLVGVLFGLVPVVRATQIDLSHDLKATLGSARRGRTRVELGKVLVVLQVALSLLLLAGAGLFVRTLWNLRALYPGFDTERVLLFSVEPTLVGYHGAQLANLYKELLEHAQSIPGVRAVSSSRFGELTPGSATRGISVPGYVPRPAEVPEIQVNFVGPNFFRATGMVLIQGRDFALQDDENAPRVAVINQTAAHHYFDDANPLGRHISLSEAITGKIEIIGVVGDAKYHSLREGAVAMLFLPFLQSSPDSLSRMTYEVRTAVSPVSMIAAIHQQVQAIDRNLPVFDVKTIAERITESLMLERLVSTLSTLFGLLAVVLACVGLYGIMAYAVERRRNEIGIRMALGAQRQDVLGLVVGQGFKLTLIGVAIGIPAALGLTRLLSTVLYGVKPSDPATYVGVALVLTVVALAATYIPARRATKVDPMVALRYE